MKIETNKEHLLPNRNYSTNFDNGNRKTKQDYQPSFKGPLNPLGGLITQTLVTIDTNQMINAALIDVGAMVIPRTYVDGKERNKYAGAETFIREIMGTFCVCLSSGIFAKGISRLYNHFVNPETKINPDIWATKDGLALLKHSWDKSETNGQHNVEKYVSKILTNISGRDGRKDISWNEIKDWNTVKWLDNPKWENYNWKNSKYNGIQHSLKDGESIIRTLSEIITDRNIHKKDAEKIQEIIGYRITNALGVGNSVNIELLDKESNKSLKLNSSLSNVIRDTYDLGKDIFTNKNIHIDSALEKLTKMSKVKTIGGLAASSFLALITQYVNRQITKKRTGTDAFVGDVNYDKIKDNKDKTRQDRLWGLKLLASAGMIGMSAAVMKIKNPADFVKKLEFTGVVTSGNAMKTIYAAQLTGRFLAASDENELRESTTRDYFGFLNWLVFGGFVSKGVANMLDTDKNKLFNISEEGSGIRHWLNKISLKSHAEVAAKGKEFAKENIWKINLAHASGLLYSVLALGFAVPLLNIFVTSRKHKKDNIEK